MIDEHQPRRRVESRFAPLSVEERSYLEARQAIFEGRMSQQRDKLDWRENRSRFTSAVRLGAAGIVVGAAALFLGVLGLAVVESLSR